MLSKILLNKPNKLASQAVRAFSAGNSVWKSMSQAPADPIMGLNVAF